MHNLHALTRLTCRCIPRVQLEFGAYRYNAKRLEAATVL